MTALTIAIAGKGGCGKSTVAALSAQIISWLGFNPTLVVDADPAGSLGYALGIEPSGTVADLRDELRQTENSSGESKERVLSAGLERLITEGEELDLLVMGRPPGRGCYCFINRALADSMSRLIHRYKVVIVDNEAGMEHLARGNMPWVDILLLVAEPTHAALTVAMGAKVAVEEAGTLVRQVGLVMNRVGVEGIPASLYIPEDLPLWAELPEEAAVAEFWHNERPFNELLEHSEVGHILRKMWMDTLDKVRMA